MLKLYSFLLLIAISAQLSASEWLDLERASNAQSRINLSAEDFKIDITNNIYKLKVHAQLDNMSFKWVRFNDILLVPKAILKINIEHSNKSLYIKYKNQIYNFQHSNDSLQAHIHLSVFENQSIEVYDHRKRIFNITLKPKSAKTLSDRTLIDYSCSRNQIEVLGLDNEFFSLGCRLRPIGKYGEEKPMLEISWISPELQIQNTKLIPYNAAFVNQEPVKIDVQNIYTGLKKQLTIKALIPKRLHRLFTAYGFGPYALNTKTVDSKGDTQEISDPLAPALFFYLNYKISESTSLRGFEAAVLKESKFNNAGLYLGNDFGYSFDNRLYFSTLLGVQYLYFKFDEDSSEVSKPIFPQGVEFMYRHAFDIQNYIVSGGIFLSPSTSVDYKNIWLRWGRDYFWEINHIEWAQDNFKASTWGLSVGFPFKGFL